MNDHLVVFALLRLETATARAPSARIGLYRLAHRINLLIAPDQVTLVQRSNPALQLGEPEIQAVGGGEEHEGEEGDGGGGARARD